MRKKPKRHPQKVENEGYKAIPEKKRPSRFVLLLKNLALLAASALLVHSMQHYVKAYRWVNETLLKKNKLVMEQVRHLSYPKRAEAKIGFAAGYLRFLKEKTPEDAIIILPPDSVFLKTKGQKGGFNKVILKRGWANYFVYPRKIIYERERDSLPDLYANATHVGIVNYWGYEKLSYPVNGKVRHSVMPLKPLTHLK